MRCSPIYTTLVCLALTQFHVASASATNCEISGIEFVCKDANGPAEVSAAFADTATADALADADFDLDAFKRPADVEKFRRSVERNWRQVTIAERRQRNSMKRRRISAEQFEQWSETYKAAAENYAEAINFYRTLLWHGKHGKSAPVDAD